MLIQSIEDQLKALADERTAQIMKGFFKTGPGQYGERDRFLGIRAPQLRRLAQGYEKLPLGQAAKLLRSPFHEARMLALLILVRQAGKGDEAVRAMVYELYLAHTCHVNNWDLVDNSAAPIVGAFLLNRSKAPLYVLAESDSLWERRIAIIATFYFIKHEHYGETLKIAECLLNDKEDLIHKAVGWMLREVGKRSLPIEEAFLKRHYSSLPRTLLRYAIERFPEAKRRRYLIGDI